MSLIDRIFPKNEPAVARSPAAKPATNGSAPLPGMVPANRIGKDTQTAAATDARPAADGELVARRDRLIEKFAVMQSDLGGLFYEMAIRDHVKLDVLTRKAAELQRVDAQLGQVERLLKLDESGAAGSCTNCGALYTRGSAFCSQCGHPLVGGDATTGHDLGP